MAPPLCLAALSCLIRPPNAIIWAWLGFLLVRRQEVSQAAFTLSSAALIGSVTFLLIKNTLRGIRAAALAGSAFLDHFFFGDWPVTTYQFLRQNVLQGISIYYGIMAWHYYILQALPQLLWTLLPFSLLSMFRTHMSAPLKQLRSCVAIVLLAFSFLQHKEVRFVQPLLPILHLFAAEGLCRTRRRSIRFALVLAHVLPAVYLLRYHAKAQISVMQYLRQANVESVAFLMPCHSTPWQSHLHRPDLELPGLDGSGASGEGGYLWFITCEPPVLCVDSGSQSAANQIAQGPKRINVPGPV
jgi:phosphatidylinositol glycan class B